MPGSGLGSRRQRSCRHRCGVHVVGSFELLVLLCLQLLVRQAINKDTLVDAFYAGDLIIGHGNGFGLGVRMTGSEKSMSDRAGVFDCAERPNGLNSVVVVEGGRHHRGVGAFQGNFFFHGNSWLVSHELIGEWYFSSSRDSFTPLGY
ncbi:hypothetical protein Pnap_4901 (plasmid) [Polaromonas naphthalenivorans CJ2]|uniref:Uncharacterized protein n=1 Tax=Polaromonas naphthalenivorans (strain CJ2) TaxID=365044 RepID=A1VWD7_POLNA|nr:hypothetical protein Pnap_4901 [Polaromonas naphthalenivorans CJ2]